FELGLPPLSDEDIRPAVMKMSGNGQAIPSVVAAPAHNGHRGFCDIRQHSYRRVGSASRRILHQPASGHVILLDRPPADLADLVVSGMNSGANVGVNHIYSGTVAAAIEAGLLGLPSIAVSLHLHKDVPVDHVRAAAWALEAIRAVLAAGLKAGEVVSINIPALPAGESPRGIKVVRQCTRPFIDTYERRLDPRGREYFWNSS